MNNWEGKGSWVFHGQGAFERTQQEKGGTHAFCGLFNERKGHRRRNAWKRKGESHGGPKKGVVGKKIQKGKKEGKGNSRGIKKKSCLLPKKGGSTIFSREGGEPYPKKGGGTSHEKTRLPERWRSQGKKEASRGVSFLYRKGGKIPVEKVGGGLNEIVIFWGI